MYVCWDVHQDIYLDIWVRRIIIIKDANYESIVCFAEYAFIGFYIRFPAYGHYYIIVVYILPFHLYSIPPVSCPYLIIPWVFPTWHHLLYKYLLLHACTHDTVFNACLWVRFIDTRVLIYLSMYATWHLHHHLLGSSDFPGSSCPGLGAWTDVDLFLLRTKLTLQSRQTSCSSSPFLAPAGWLAAFPVNSWAPFCTIHTCISPYTLALAPSVM